MALWPTSWRASAVVEPNLHDKQRYLRDSKNCKRFSPVRLLESGRFVVITKLFSRTPYIRRTFLFLTVIAAVIRKDGYDVQPCTPGTVSSFHFDSERVNTPSLQVEVPSRTRQLTSWTYNNGAMYLSPQFKRDVSRLDESVVAEWRHMWCYWYAKANDSMHDLRTTTRARPLIITSTFLKAEFLVRTSYRLARCTWVRKGVLFRTRKTRTPHAPKTKALALTIGESHNCIVKWCVYWENAINNCLFDFFLVLRVSWLSHIALSIYAQL